MASEEEAPAPRKPRAPTPARKGLIRRLWRTADRQVSEIETRLVAAGGDAASLERDAKTLAVLARTVRDLVALDAETTRTEKAGQADAEQEGPRDFEHFRRDLADTLERLAKERGLA